MTCNEEVLTTTKKDPNEDVEYADLLDILSEYDEFFDDQEAWTSDRHGSAIVESEKQCVDQVPLRGEDGTEGRVSCVPEPLHAASLHQPSNVVGPIGLTMQEEVLDKETLEVCVTEGDNSDITWRGEVSSHALHDGQETFPTHGNHHSQTTKDSPPPIPTRSSKRPLYPQAKLVSKPLPEPVERQRDERDKCGQYDPFLRHVDWKDSPHLGCQEEYLHYERQGDNNHKEEELLPPLPPKGRTPAQTMQDSNHLTLQHQSSRTDATVSNENGRPWLAPITSFITRVRNKTTTHTDDQQRSEPRPDSPILNHHIPFHILKGQLCIPPLEPGHEGLAPDMDFQCRGLPTEPFESNHMGWPHQNTSSEQHGSRPIPRRISQLPSQQKRLRELRTRNEELERRLLNPLPGNGRRVVSTASWASLGLEAYRESSSGMSLAAITARERAKRAAKEEIPHPSLPLPPPPLLEPHDETSNHYRRQPSTSTEQQHIPPQAERYPGNMPSLRYSDAIPRQLPSVTNITPRLEPIVSTGGLLDLHSNGTPRRIGTSSLDETPELRRDQQQNFPEHNERSRQRRENLEQQANIVVAAPNDKPPADQAAIYPPNTRPASETPSSKGSSTSSNGTRITSLSSMIEKFNDGIDRKLDRGFDWVKDVVQDASSKRRDSKVKAKRRGEKKKKTEKYEGGTTKHLSSSTSSPSSSSWSIAPPAAGNSSRRTHILTPSPLRNSSTSHTTPHHLPTSQTSFPPPRRSATAPDPVPISPTTTPAAAVTLTAARRGRSNTSISSSTTTTTSTGEKRSREYKDKKSAWAFDPLHEWE